MHAAKVHLWFAMAAFLAGLAGCQSPGSRNSSVAAVSPSSASLEQRPKPNVRELRARLVGKEMKHVVNVLGPPAQVFTLEQRETWQYKDAAYDPATGRTVRSLDVLFLNRRVESVNFSY